MVGTASEWPPLVRYALAVLLSGLALVLTLFLGPLSERSDSLLFVVAIVVSSLYGGAGPGLVAVALSTLASAFFFLPPTYNLLVGLDDLLRLGVFLLVMSTISWLAGRRKQAEERLQTLNRELEQRVAERTAELEEANRELRQQIARREVLQRQLEHQAAHDQLTDLLNRPAFYEGLGRALARARRRDGKVALLFFDLDDFKLVNDSLGHQMGDLVLVEIARRLKECLREADTAARLGGDEFAVLLEDLTDGSEAVVATERFLKQLEAPLELRGRRLSVTASVGIAFATGEDPEELVRAADAAMYQAKDTGKAYSVMSEPI